MSTVSAWNLCMERTMRCQRNSWLQNQDFNVLAICPKINHPYMRKREHCGLTISMLVYRLGDTTPSNGLINTLCFRWCVNTQREGLMFSVFVSLERMYLHFCLSSPFSFNLKSKTYVVPSS